MEKLMRMVALVSVLGLALIGSAAGSATTTTTSQSFPIQFLSFVPCASGGSGESILLAGNLHEVVSVTMTGNGGAKAFVLDNPQGITGTGMTTGATYHATGETLNTFTTRIGSQQSFVNNFKIIGQGPGNNLLVHENAHLTVNAGGTVTASVDNLSVTCR